MPTSTQEKSGPRCGGAEDVTRPLGTPDDLQAHEEILDAVVAEAPILPFRFGGALASEDAVVEELLEPNHDAFAAALSELEDRAEYIVRGRYVEQASHARACPLRAGPSVVAPR